MLDDDYEEHSELAIISEREAVADGRPSVYTRPIMPHFSNVAGRRRASLPFYKDRLLLALKREHHRPRYDLPAGIG